MSIVHSDLKYRRPLVAQQSDCFAFLVQLVDAPAAVLVPKQKLSMMAQAECMVKLLALIDDLLNQGGKSLLHIKTKISTDRQLYDLLYVCTSKSDSKISQKNMS